MVAKRARSGGGGAPGDEIQRVGLVGGEIPWRRAGGSEISRWRAGLVRLHSAAGGLGAARIDDGWEEDDGARPPWRKMAPTLLKKMAAGRNHPRSPAVTPARGPLAASGVREVPVTEVRGESAEWG